MSFGARALIRLGALTHNLDVVRNAAPGAKVMAVVKANAYGHGMLTVTRHLGEDVDAFAVARLSEALQLRRGGISTPIVLLEGVLDESEQVAAVADDIELVVHVEEQVALLERQQGGSSVVWLKIDTGMNRLGFAPEDAAAVAERLARCGAVSELRLMTHMASADELDNSATDVQFERFRAVASGFDGAVSLANSPATLGWPKLADARTGLGFLGDHWIRPGIALYGISPFADRGGRDLGLIPVMQFEARLIAVKPLLQGSRVGYGGRFQSDRDSTLGIVAAGYGDGYSRHFKDGTPVMINGRRVPLIGNVAMDMLAVDLGPDATDSAGDLVTLWGDDLPVEEIAPWADAIPYDLVCGITNREASEISG